MHHVADLRLESKGKLTMEPDCTAIGSSFTLLSRDVKRTELYNFNGVNLIIPNVNLTPSNIELDILNKYENFSKHHKDLILNHVNHQINDLNSASIRISKLRNLMNDFESARAQEASTKSHTVYETMLLILVVIVVLFIILTKLGLVERIRKGINKPNDSHVVLALRERHAATSPRNSINPLAEVRDS